MSCTVVFGMPLLRTESRFIRPMFPKHFEEGENLLSVDIEEARL